MYPTPAEAFLAARTLDQEMRAALAGTLGAAAAVCLAGLATVRDDWRALRDEVAWAVVRAA
ncbi:hypothetical protein [Deinococcus ficus]|uniref:hypothetical protein n=1 Tax=Deinococcus ficus TaxID=317577 RepID=UPI00131BE905|nr:hypothetical protein [Deinococcus ficus]